MRVPLKAVLREMNRRGDIQFEDSAKGKIARREVQALDKINKAVLPLIRKVLYAATEMYKFDKKWNRYFHGRSECDYAKLIKELQNYEQDAYFGRKEDGFDDTGWFEDLE